MCGNISAKTEMTLIYGCVEARNGWEKRYTQMYVCMYV